MKGIVRIDFRLSFAQTIKRSLVTNQTIEPTLVGALPQFTDETNGTRVQALTAATDIRLSDRVYVGVSAERRWISPRPEAVEGTRSDGDETIFSAYGYWTLSDRLAATAVPALDMFSQSAKDAGGDPKQVRTLSMPLGLRYFAPSGLFATATTTLLAQEIELSNPDGERQLDATAVLVDLGLGYRLPNQRGTLALQAFNLLDRRFHYFDDTFRTPEFDNQRVVPQRTFLVSLTFTL